MNSPHNPAITIHARGAERNTETYQHSRERVGPEGPRGSLGAVGQHQRSVRQRKAWGSPLSCPREATLGRQRCHGEAVAALSGRPHGEASMQGAGTWDNRWTGRLRLHSSHAVGLAASRGALGVAGALEGGRLRRVLMLGARGRWLPDAHHWAAPRAPRCV